MCHLLHPRLGWRSPAVPCGVTMGPFVISLVTPPVITTVPGPAALCGRTVTGPMRARSAAHVSLESQTRLGWTRPSDRVQPQPDSSCWWQIRVRSSRAHPTSFCGEELPSSFHIFSWQGALDLNSCLFVVRISQDHLTFFPGEELPSASQILKTFLFAEAFPFHQSFPVRWSRDPPAAPGWPGRR